MIVKNILNSFNPSSTNDIPEKALRNSRLAYLYGAVGLAAVAAIFGLSALQIKTDLLVHASSLTNILFIVLGGAGALGMVFGLRHMYKGIRLNSSLSPSERKTDFVFNLLNLKLRSK